MTPLAAARCAAQCFFAGVTWDDMYVGFTEVPGGITYSDRNVLAYHFYRTVNFDPSLIMHARALDRLRLKSASFMTEFEMGAHDEKGIEEAERTLDLAESWWQSWAGASAIRRPPRAEEPGGTGAARGRPPDPESRRAGWEYKLFDPITGANNGFFPYYATGNLTVSPTVREVVSRTYTAAIAGRGRHTSYDRKTRRFELSYDAKPGCKLPTEIYLNEADHYPFGFKARPLPRAPHSAIAPESRSSRAVDRVARRRDMGAPIPTGSMCAPHMGTADLSI